MTLPAFGLGYRTTFAGLPPATTITHDDGFSIAETPSQPDFWDGNALFLHDLPDPEDLPNWVERFRATFPAAKHTEVWWEDDTVPADVDPDTLAREAAWNQALGEGLALERLRVMELTSLVAPRFPSNATLAIADDPRHWAGVKAINLQESSSKDPEFWEWHTGAFRAAQEAGAMTTWVAYRMGIPAGTMSVVCDGEGLAAVDAVITHPAHRRHGVAATLVHEAVTQHLGVHPDDRVTLLVDDGAEVQRLYANLGFEDRGVVWVAIHAAAAPSASDQGDP